MVVLFVNLRFICSAKDIVDTYIIKFRQSKKGFSRGDSLSVFKFGKQRLLNSGLHLQGDLRITSAFSQLL